VAGGWLVNWYMKEKSKLGFIVPDELWARWEPLMGAHPNTHPFGGGRPRRADRDCANAIFFVLRTGCQWAALDVTGLCPHSTAHDRFQEWVQSGLWQKLWEEALHCYDELQGLDWSFLCADGSMVKAPLAQEQCGPNPTDRGKQGVKRSLLTDTHGIPLSVVIAGANVNDHFLLDQTLRQCVVERPRPSRDHPQGLCLDKGYDYALTRQIGEEHHLCLHLRTRGEEVQAKKHQRGYKARRWVVERSGSWINRYRRILVRWEKKAANYMGMLGLTCACIAFEQAGLFG
jgi:putative transposase